MNQKILPVKFQNRRNTTAIWLNKFVLTLVFTILIITTGFVKWFDNPVLGLERVNWIIIVITIWLLIVSFQNFRQPCYIYLEDMDDMIIIRYYPLRIINQKKKSIEISKNAFVKFEIRKFFWGMYEKLILYQKFRKGIAKYPPISLSAVSRKDIEKIKLILGKYALES